MAEPFLDPGDIGAVAQRIGGRGRPQGVGAEPADLAVEPGGPRVMADDVAVDRGRVERAVEVPAAVVAHRAEQRPGGAVAGGGEIGPGERERGRVGGDVADLAALALDAQVEDALAHRDVGDAQPAERGAPEPVIEQHGQDRAVALALQRCGIGGVEQASCLGVAECGRRAPLPFAGGRATRRNSSGRRIPAKAMNAPISFA